MRQSKNTEWIRYEQETTPLDIYYFIKKSWKFILLWAFLGFFGAVVYILTTPPMYEATAQIRMAQISQVNTANPFGTTIEEPNSLISRMQFPTNYTEHVTSVCGYQGDEQPALTLSKAAKFSSLKGMANTVELKILAPSRQTAENCAEAIFLQIVQMQEQFSKVFVEEAKIKLASDNERIDAARRLINKADQSGSAMSAAYLSARDELTYFLTDREKMADLINSVKNRGTNLASPIYVSEKPVSPKKFLSLLSGLMGGLFFGFAIALAYQTIRRLKDNAE